LVMGLNYRSAHLVDIIWEQNTNQLQWHNSIQIAPSVRLIYKSLTGISPRNLIGLLRKTNFSEHVSELT
jgi:hypothetical protein